MSKGLRTAAFQGDVARARLAEASLPVEMRPVWGVYLLERAPDGVGLTVEAPTLARLFVDAARAMGEQLGKPLGAAGRIGVEAHELSVVAATADQLLVAWLGELLYCARQTGRLFNTINVRRISAVHLRAEMRADRETRWLTDPASIAVVDARVATVADALGKRLVARLRLAAPAARRGSR